MMKRKRRMWRGGWSWRRVMREKNKRNTRTS
jgi:hypothetical protein